MTVVGYPFASMAALRRDIAALDRHQDELSNWECRLMRFAIDLVSEPNPSARDLAWAMAIITTCASQHSEQYLSGVPCSIRRSSCALPPPHGPDVTPSVSACRLYDRGNADHIRPRHRAARITIF
jgi:hypothetical protein